MESEPQAVNGEQESAYPDGYESFADTTGWLRAHAPKPVRDEIARWFGALCEVDSADLPPGVYDNDILFRQAEPYDGPRLELTLRWEGDTLTERIPLQVLVNGAAVAGRVEIVLAGAVDE